MERGIALAESAIAPDTQALAGPIAARKHRTPFGDTIATLRRKPLAIGGFVVVMVWLVLGITAPILPIDDPNAQNLSARLEAPNAEHYFGTDELGRDLFSRVIYGARVSLPAGVLVIFASGLVGCSLGAAAGFFGGTVDSIIMRISDAVLAFPSIILAMTITAVRGGPGLSNALFAVEFVLWPEYARLMRGQVLTLRENDY